MVFHHVLAIAIFVAGLLISSKNRILTYIPHLAIAELSTVFLDIIWGNNKLLEWAQEQQKKGISAVPEFTLEKMKSLDSITSILFVLSFFALRVVWSPGLVFWLRLRQ